MSLFRYRALDKGGKEVHGRIEAGTEATVIERLRNLGYYPTEVSRAKDSGLGNLVIEDLPLIRNAYRFVTQGRVKSKNLALFTRQLATLISAGLPLLRSMRILYDQVTSTNLRKIIRDVGDAVENGSTLSEALARHPPHTRRYSHAPQRPSRRFLSRRAPKSGADSHISVKGVIRTSPAGTGR